MNISTNSLRSFWESRLLKEYPQASVDRRKSLIHWLLRKNFNRLEELTPQELIQVNQGISDRYHILRQRYLTAEPLGAYCHLISQLGSLSARCPQLRHWGTSHREQQKVLFLTLQAMVQDLLANDRYIQKTISWIARCTSDASLRNALLLTHLEEYCYRQWNDRPLLMRLLTDFLVRQAQQDRLLPLQRDLMQVLSSTIEPAYN